MTSKVFLLPACILLTIAPLSCVRSQGKSIQNLAIARTAMRDIYGDGNLALVDELYADGFVDDSPGGGKGRALIKEAVSSFHRAFPDLRIDIEDSFAVDDKVVLRYTARGTQSGGYYDIPPSGKAVAIRGITVFQIVDGKIRTEWTEYDRLGAMRQIGAIP